MLIPWGRKTCNFMVGRDCARNWFKRGQAVEMEMNWVCDHRSESQFKQLRKSPKKKKDFGASTGFEPVVSAFSAAVLYQPELWRPICWRPANLLSSLTHERNETKNEMMWTAEIQMNWVCDHRSESQFKQLRKSPKKKGFRGFNGIRTRIRNGNVVQMER